MRHIISLLLENESGALSRVVDLFSARGFNIESLTVAETHISSLSRLTLVSIGSDDVIEQIVKQLEKLVDTIKVIDLTKKPHIERELMLIKIIINEKNFAQIKQLVDIFSCQIVDVSEKTYIIDISGKSRKLDAFLNALIVFSKANILEVSRTGAMGVYRGQSVL